MASSSPHMASQSAISAADSTLSVPAAIAEIGLSEASPKDYLALMKPRVMSLVVFTAFVGLLVAPGTINPLVALATLVCIAIGAGASGALNMWYDRDIDAIMRRTRTRPLPQGKMPPASALTFGVILSVMAVLGLAVASNYYAAGLLAFTIFFYAVIYTHYLKRSTPQNIVIGGAAGAFPPMIGWAAASGGTLTQAPSMEVLSVVFAPESLLLFLLIFLWTPPHFWSLALYKKIDYDKAGIPMMPNVKGARSTRAQIFGYALVLTLVCGLVGLSALGSPIYAFGAAMLNAGFVALAYKVWRSQAGESKDGLDEASLYAVMAGDKTARNLFAYSIVYLFALFALIAVTSFLKGMA